MSPTRVVSIAVVLLVTAAGCGDVNAALERLVEARQVAADLHVEFTKAADAANRAVMADTDETSVAYAREATEAKQAVQRDVDTLGPMLQSLGYTDESGLLKDFVARYAEYDAVDRRILDLAVENTNLKAQRLSFGPVQDTADTLRDALTAMKASASADGPRVDALAMTAMAALREIQALQAPHIAEADDAAMARIEKRMAAAEQSARQAIGELRAIVDAPSRSKLVIATADLDRFISLNAQVIALSRQNTNVRSLALSLSQKPALVAACDDRLKALEAALGKRGYHSGVGK